MDIINSFIVFAINSQYRFLFLNIQKPAEKLILLYHLPLNNYIFRQNNLEDEILKKNHSHQAILMIFI